MLFGSADIFAVSAYPLEDEVDPTGAGDSFAGGFFGYLAEHPSLDEVTLRRAVIFGSVMGSFCVEDFGIARLQRLTPEEIRGRYAEMKRLMHFEDVDTP
jgi:sugar/nucleoside kinase (ribokinase family)